MSYTKYNGWTNWETWNCKLWLDNDQGVYFTVRDIVYEGVRHCYSAYDLGENIHDIVLDLYEDDTGKPWGFFNDVVYAAMRDVNWTEIAQHMIDDVKEEIKQDAVGGV